MRSRYNKDMRTTTILADARAIPLNPFITGLVENVAQGIVRSLKLEADAVRTIEFRLPAEAEMTLQVNGTPVSLQLTTGFSRRIIESTLRGLLQPLKGTEGAKEIFIKIEEANL